MTTSSDVAEVTALIERYADCIDDGDLDGLADLFRAGVLRSPRGVARGRDEVRAQYDAVLLDEHGRPGTHHVVFDVEVDVDGAAATARSVVTVTQGGLPIIAGRYHDRFVRDANGWRFEEREIFLDLLGDLSNHFRLPSRAATEGLRHD